MAARSGSSRSHRQRPRRRSQKPRKPIIRLRPATNSRGFGSAPICSTHVRGPTPKIGISLGSCFIDLAGLSRSGFLSLEFIALINRRPTRSSRRALCASSGRHVCANLLYKSPSTCRCVFTQHTHAQTNCANGQAMMCDWPSNQAVRESRCTSCRLWAPPVPAVKPR